MARDKGSGSVYQRDDGKWVASLEAGWTTRGTRRRLRVVAPTKREALRKLQDKRREIARTGIPEEGARAAITVKAFADQWIEARATTARPGTFTADRSAVTQWIIPTIGHVKLNRVSAAHVRSVTTAIIDAGRRESTAIRVHAVLTMMLKAAQQDGHTIPPGALTVSPPSKNETDRAEIPLEDARLILTAAATRPDASRWLTAFLEAPRPAEALGLTWDCVDLERGVLDLSWQLKQLNYRVSRDASSGFRVPRGYETRYLIGRFHLVRPKTSAGKRVIPLIPVVSEALAAWREVAPRSPFSLVWPDPDGMPLDDHDDRAAWRTICDQAQVASTAPWHVTRDGHPVASVQGRRYDLYEARHTTASLLRAAGVSDDIITMIMGHASILSSEAYIHISMDTARQQLARAVEALQLPKA
jgi:integrase